MTINDQADLVAIELQEWITKNVQALRAVLNFTQKDLAAKIGVSQSNVAALEGGRTTWNIKHLARMAVAFGIEPHELITGPQPAPTITDDESAVVAAMKTGNYAMALRALADWSENEPAEQLTPQQQRAMAAIPRGDVKVIGRILSEMLDAQDKDRTSPWRLHRP